MSPPPAGSSSALQHASLRHAGPSTAELRAWVASHLDPLDGGAVSNHGERSDFDLNPAMAPAHDGPLVPAAVLTALVERPEGLTVLLTRRVDTLRRHAGQVAFPGGRMDPGETAPQAALREAQEEIDLDPAHVELVGLSTPYRTGSGYLITPVVGFVSPNIALKPNPAEVAHIFETPFGYLMDPANLERRSYETPDGGSRHFYAINWEDQMIWGATAGMLRALYDRLYGAAFG